MALTLVTPSAADVVSLADFKASVRAELAETTEDVFMLECLRRAQAHLGERTGWSGVVCLTTTLDLKLDAFPCGGMPWLSLRDWAIRVPVRPVQSVTSVKYLDPDGVEQTLTPVTDYTVHVEEDPSPCLIMPAYGKSWPSARAVLNAVTVRFIAGFTGPGAIPPNMRSAVLVLAGHFYTHRDDEVPLPLDTLGALLVNERIWS